MLGALAVGMAVGDEKPERPADLPPDAALAMRAALMEVGREASGLCNKVFGAEAPETKATATLLAEAVEANLPIDGGGVGSKEAHPPTPPPVLEPRRSGRRPR